MQNKMPDTKTLRWITLYLLLFLAILLLAFNVWIGTSSATVVNPTPTPTLPLCKSGHVSTPNKPCRQPSAAPTAAKATAKATAKARGSTTPTPKPSPSPTPTPTRIPPLPTVTIHP